MTTVNIRRMGEIGAMLAEEITKIGQAFMTMQKRGCPPPELQELFLNVAALARMGAAELDGVQEDVPVTAVFN